MARVVMCVQNMPVPNDRRVWREARALRDAGHRVAVISPGRPELPRRERLEGIEVRRFGSGPQWRGLAGQIAETTVTLAATAWFLVGLRLRGRIDVLHVANPPDTYFVLGWLLRPFGTRFVYDQHDVCPELLDAQAGPSSRKARVLRPLLERLERASYRCADLVISPNTSYRAIALRRGRGVVDPESVVVVRSGPDELAFQPPAVRPTVVVFAGMINVQDRVDLLLDAAADVLRRRPGSLRVVVIGTGDDVPRLQARVASLGINDAVTWTGWLTGDALRTALQQGTIAVSLDGDDEFSRVSTMTKVPEYIALGLPCLLADLPENRVSAGDAALYFPPGDAAALAASLESIVDEPTALDVLADRARRRAPSLLWQHSAERLVAAYRWLLDGGPAVPGDHVPGAQEHAASNSSGANAANSPDPPLVTVA
jgi:glycosyltransferase involved in cell wall biosynthesis